MTNRRRLTGCGRVNNSATGKEEVVVVGGQIPIYNWVVKTSRIYTVEDNTWRQGPSLPTHLKESASLPYGDSFLILGGDKERDQTSCVDSIFQVYLLIFYISDRYLTMRGEKNQPLIL